MLEKKSEFLFDGSGLASQFAVPITDPSQVGEARRLSRKLASDNGLSEDLISSLSLVVNESGTNILKHAGSGDLLFRILRNRFSAGIEVLALDKGPGIRNVNASISDCYSTKESLGIGLGVIARHSNFFRIYSRSGRGTVLLSRLWPVSAAEPKDFDHLSLGAICLPKPGEIVSGDQWVAVHHRDKTTVLLADGLGHGPAAAEAALTAADAFGKVFESTPERIIREVSRTLQSTRGAAVAAAELNAALREIRYASVGNVAGFILSPNQKTFLMSYPGIVGALNLRIEEFCYPFPEDSVLIMHSDGLSSRWNLSDCPCLSLDPSLTAGILYRDFRREIDDVTVIAIRIAHNE